jgi:single-strand DNA-binding protein
MAGTFTGTVVGYVAKDPEARGNGPMGFSIPVSKGKDKPTTWVRVSCWGKTADYVAQYIKKGSLVSVSGSIELREFESAKGKGTSLEMNASSVTSFRTDSAPAQGGGFAQKPGFGGPSEDDLAF